MRFPTEIVLKGAGSRGCKGNRCRPPAIALRATRHMLVLSAVFMALTFAVFVVYGLCAASVRRHIIARPRVLTWMRRAFAGAFVALGAKLALAER